MFNNFQKSLLIFLFLYASPSIYAMENQSGNTSEKHISTNNSGNFINNKKFYNAAIVAINNKFSKEEDFKIIKQCLDNGADIDFPLTKHKVTLLMFAINFKKGDLVDYLLQRKADVNFCAPHNGLPLLINLFKVTPKSEKLDIHIMKSLLKHGTSPNGAQTWKEAPLFCAIREGHSDAVKLLIKYKADINLKNDRGCAPLREAILKEDFDTIKELRGAGAVLHDIDSKSNTALHYMTNKKNDEIKNFIKCICINPYNKEQGKLFKQTIIGTFLTFKKLNELPRFPQISKDLQFHIVSKIPLNCLYGNREIRDILLKKNYDLILPEVYKQVKVLEEASIIQNKDGRTALQLLHHNYAQDQSHINNVGKFFDPNLIKKDWEDFIKVCPNAVLVSEDNVACIVYDSHLSLINNK